MKRFFFAALPLCGLILSASVAFGQKTATPEPTRNAQASTDSVLGTPKKLPNARQVFQNHLNAIGGDEAIESVKNVMTTGTIEIPAAGVKGSLKIIQVKPNKMATTTELGQLGTTSQVFDGEMGWMSSGMMGTQKMPEDQVEQLKAQMAVETMEGFKDTYKDAKIVGQTEFEGVETYQMDAVSKSDDKVSMYFDIDTGLMHGMKMVSKTPMGEIPVTVVTEDYESVGPIKMSKKSVMKMGPQTIVMTVDDVKINTDIPAETFKRPADL